MARPLSEWFDDHGSEIIELLRDAAVMNPFGSRLNASIRDRSATLLREWQEES